MAPREFFITTAFLLSVMAVLALVESIAPLFAPADRSKGRGMANLSLTVVTFVLNWGLNSTAAVVALALSFQARGLLAPLPLSLPARIAISVVTLDLFTYLAHLTMHKIPPLWRVHSVHHSDPFLDVSTTFRQHPLEGIWRFLWIIVPVWILGLPASGVVAYRVLSAGNGVLEHANIGLWQPFDRALSLFWTTPNMHKIHHSRLAKQTDSNYGNILSLFDRGFHTFTPTEQALSVTYGLENSDTKRAKSLVGLLTLPFARPRTGEM